MPDCVRHKYSHVTDSQSKGGIDSGSSSSSSSSGRSIVNQVFADGYYNVSFWECNIEGTIPPPPPFTNWISELALFFVLFVCYSWFCFNPIKLVYLLNCIFLHTQALNWSFLNPWVSMLIIVAIVNRCFGFRLLFQKSVSLWVQGNVTIELKVKTCNSV